MNPFALCVVTIDDIEKAATIAHSLVEEKLVACVNIIPNIRSIYRWKGRIYDEREFIMIAKTRTSLYTRFEQRVRELHHYETPEIIMLNIENGLPEYLKWIHDCTLADE